ncbi:hypothetical protein [Burkholderia glumae]|uniref:hypothetical protein n=1 Tax=Burkholderia glumae TaxID=337 RepID=UPI000F5E39CC|nr:hypothetical protein [Burkholderia glumae]
MSQEFNKPVGQAIQADQASITGASTTVNTGSVSGNVAGRDVINNNFRSEEDEDLDDERKQQLSRRAYILEVKHGRERWKTRTLVNEIVGVTSQDVMRAKHFFRASKVYDLLFELEKTKLKAATPADAASLHEQLQGSADAVIQQTERNGQLMAENKRLRDENAVLAQREKSARSQAEAALAEVEIARAQTEEALARASQAVQSSVVVARPRRNLIVAAAIVGISLVALGSLYEAPHAHSSTTPSVATNSNEGNEASLNTGMCKGVTKLHPVGAIIRGTSGKIKCVAGAPGEQPRWEKLK